MTNPDTNIPEHEEIQEPTLQDYTYHVFKDNDEIGDKLIEKNGPIARFTLRSMHRDIEEGKKHIAGAKAAAEPSRLMIENIEQHHPFIKETLDAFTVEQKHHFKLYMQHLIKYETYINAMEMSQVQLDQLVNEMAHVREVLGLNAE